MIIVKLKGGLGNQLFQYATGRAVAENRNEGLLLDLSFLDKTPGAAYTKRNFELSQIKYKAHFAKKEQLDGFNHGSLISRAMNKFRLKSNFVFNENKHGYIPVINRLPKNVLLNGFWQSQKYFNLIRKQLLSEIVPDFEFTPSGKKYREQIQSANSVSVHVRRGDFINLKSAHDYHGACTINYYKRAIEKMKGERQVLFFVFSDDIDWCKKDLTFLNNVVFIENEPEKKSSQDLFLMSYCKHNIIANSSYSWWGAWLNDNSNKKVIAPEYWYNGIKSSEIDILCPGWQTCDNRN